MEKSTVEKVRKQSAGARLKEQGKSLVWTTFDATEKAQIRTAAAIAGVPMSEFLRQNGLKAAEKILKKSR